MLNFEQNQSDKAPVAVALSGGVDSSIAACLLKKQGYEVIAIYMQNWEPDNDNPYCTLEQDRKDAEAVANQLNIPLIPVNFAKEYWNSVFDRCLNEFAKGRTPNPDVWCNRAIKFDVLLKYAKNLGVSHLATGHYAQLAHHNDSFRLLKSSDAYKDQTYFLYMLDQHQLSQSLFPLECLPKSEVRALARTLNLITHDKKDSTGICFIGERRFKSFLQEFLLAQPGNIETPDGKIIGRHDGVIYYTHGQRKGLSIGGKANCEEAPWYVLDKDIKRNVLIVGQGHDHPLLHKKQLIFVDAHWISGTPPRLPLTCRAKTRYRQADQACTLYREHEAYRVEFETTQRALTPGQSIVFYSDSECLGGGIIEDFK